VWILSCLFQRTIFSRWTWIRTRTRKKMRIEIALLNIAQNTLRALKAGRF
jgi:hypothetical protein